ncbi:hypothetical protein PICMEDRAFT_138675 [Pichia membranifaciens NRRL Y-2026]|uniref:Uncharacterized protein n=1 Tax=Pichia membranifaciens NRRL Y-2026 TaxID=763406 RepID=A0A1E3NLF4_9ASCO|nr:hypothetical protein PICMEDRAFT_138675 [Pichia membranifaciens NRRL Y-2026]ODQ46906.1 hypothetical protein PICMEDRAFT_138675 [Pichia membranifaciens NRRL Y-2026]
MVGIETRHWWRQENKQTERVCVNRQKMVNGCLVENLAWNRHRTRSIRFDQTVGQSNRETVGLFSLSIRSKRKTAAGVCKGRKKKLVCEPRKANKQYGGAWGREKHKQSKKRLSGRRGQAGKRKDKTQRHTGAGGRNRAEQSTHANNGDQARQTNSASAKQVQNK